MHTQTDALKIALDAIVAELAPVAERYPFVRAKRLPGIALTTHTRMPAWRAEDAQLTAARYLVEISVVAGTVKKTVGAGNS